MLRLQYFSREGGRRPGEGSPYLQLILKLRFRSSFENVVPDWSRDAERLCAVAKVMMKVHLALKSNPTVVRIPDVNSIVHRLVVQKTGPDSGHHSRGEKQVSRQEQNGGSNRS